MAEAKQVLLPTQATTSNNRACKMTSMKMTLRAQKIHDQPAKTQSEILVDFFLVIYIDAYLAILAKVSLLAASHHLT